MSQSLVEWATVLGTACWIICFWWMHIISSRQNAMLEELREQTRRIEAMSKEEHALIKEVHPQVSQIKEDVSEMAAEVTGIAKTVNEDSLSAASKAAGH